MRTVAVALLIALGALFAFSANATVWANRTIFGTDEFVTTVEGVFNDEEVQNELASRLTARLMTESDIEQRLDQRLGDDLGFLVAPVLRQVEELVYNAILRIIQSDQFAGVFDTALRGVHAQIIRIIEDESAIGFDDTAIVIDLTEVLRRVADQLGIDLENGILSNVTIPEGAGQIVLIEDAEWASLAYRLARLHNTIAWIVVGAAVAAFALAVLVARDRRATVRTIGYTLIAVGLLAAVALVGIREIAAAFARNDSVARAAFTELVQGYRDQSFVIILAGLLVAGVAALFGGTAMARLIRGAVRRDGSTSDAALREDLRQSATALRVGGLAVGALVLLLWPDPTTRFYISALTLISLYMATIWIFTSDTDAAASTRDRVSAGWRRAFSDAPSGEDAAGARGWIARSTGTLRLVGVLIVAAILLFWPGLTLGGAVAVIGVGLVYLAAIEWLTPSPQPV